jgi:signal transduction histidine kinase
MNTLRAKLVLLLAIVIVSVVGLLTGVFLLLLRPPGERHIEPVAEQVILFARVAKQAPTVIPVSIAPSPETIRPEMTKWLRTALQRLGSNLEVTVSRGAEENAQIVSIPIDGHWIRIPIPDLPPPDGGWRVLSIWLLLITLGALAIAIFVANRMVQPLVLLEKTIESVGPDALMPELPVKGPVEVKVAAKALNSLSSRLKSAMESRMRLVAAAGHDMRTPITRMRLRAEFVGDNEDREMWLKDINELDRIADSAILLVRDELGQDAAETFCVGDLLRELIEELNALDYPAELHSGTPATVKANRHALSRAFRNLIINAATHGGGARVSIETQSDRVLVIVRDDGPGIPPAILGQVFEPFFRADPARRQQVPGVGLGLTIAREIIRRAGGDMKIANGQDRGLVQTIELPSAYL